MSTRLTSLRPLMVSLTAGGLFASAGVYLASFAGFTSDQLKYVWLLHIGAILSIFSMIAGAYDGTFRRDLIAMIKKCSPSWVTWTQYGLWALAFLQFGLYFFINRTGGSPAIVNGEYILDNHGVMQVVTQADYLRVSGYELRLFAVGWMVFYYAGAAYWSFVQRPLSKKTVGIES